MTIALLMICSVGEGMSTPEGLDSFRAAQADSLHAALADNLRVTLDERIPPVVKEGNAPAVQVAVVFEDRVLWSRAFGSGVDVDDAFMNGSVQKTFDATAVLRLAERGVVDLDADVSRYLPFPVRHPGYPDLPITLRMLLSHRSGMGVLPHQGEWDTRCSFFPDFIQDCPVHIVDLPLEEFLRERLDPEGSEFDEESWLFEPGQGYRYSVSTFGLMRYIVGRVSGQSLPEYMEENVFRPLGMENSAVGGPKVPGKRAQPHTRRNGENVELPLWDGNGYMMQTTAEDMGRFMIALLNGGQAEGFAVLEPETLAMMHERTTSRSGSAGSRDLARLGYGLGLELHRDGWFGHGGSTPGFLTLLRYHPERQVGYVVMTNVNALHGGGQADRRSVLEEVYRIQDELLAILESDEFQADREVEGLTPS
jgi:CubicO group peptidase (beta-lactamase class C family)